jgi:hypothetical protein
MAATIAAAAAARIVAGSPQDERRWTFWTGFAAPTVLLFGTRVFHVPAPSFNQWHLAGVDVRAAIPSSWIIGVVATFGVLGYVIERAWLALVRRTGVTPRYFRLMAAGLAVWIAGTLVLSLFVQFPSMPTLEAVREMPLRDYLVRLLYCVVTTPRLRGPDFFGWTTFLSGFGWLDTFLPERLLSIITAAGAALAIWLLASTAVERDGRRAAVVTIVAAGALITVIGCGIGAYGLNRTLHGRYLLGPYLAGIGLLGAGPAILPARRMTPAAYTSVLLACVLGIQAAALWVIAARYFW